MLALRSAHFQHASPFLAIYLCFVPQHASPSSLFLDSFAARFWNRFFSLIYINTLESIVFCLDLDFQWNSTCFNSGTFISVAFEP